MTSLRPPDEADRKRIRKDLDTNLFVEAGAGAGKTSSLVSRIVGLVAGGIGIGSIAAITFTDKAAADLRKRLREKLTIASIEATGQERHDLDAALEGLDGAPIGTLHSFARRILNDFPLQAGLPPGFGVLDELASNIAFEERWEDLVERLLRFPDPGAGPIDGGSQFVQLCDFDGFGVHKRFRRAAAQFHSDWDLVKARVDTSTPAPWEPGLARLSALAEHACGFAPPEGDTQHALLGQLDELATAMGRDPTLIGQLQRCAEIAKLLKSPDRKGSKAKWKTNGGDAALDELRGAEHLVRDEATHVLDQAREYRLRLVGAILGRWVLESAALRAASGNIEFHDLLVLARDLVASNEHVRTALHGRYKRILLDEFQDTDPIQLEIAVRLSADPHDPIHKTDWTGLEPLPGRLFIVGDPKQSIYRFRRADIAQYMGAADRLGAATAKLTANFRSSEPVITWVNEVFADIIEHRPGMQPGYQPLAACRPAHLAHGSVRLLGSGAHADLAKQRSHANDLRDREAADTADAVATALHEQWLVVDDHTHELRTCRPGDITILLPARTSLAALEAALTALGLPYRAESSSVVYLSTDVRHVMLALRAADDSTDELALVAALRTGLYGCSDVELYEWHLAGGAWSIWRDTPDGFHDHPVACAFAHLRSLAERSTACTPADLIAALINERRLLDMALDSTEARKVWRQLRYVVEQARAWSDAGGHGLRRYLTWVNLQATGSRSADTILPEHDDDAVRIMTIHAAKGLEFPIAVVAGLTSRPSRSTGHGVVWHDDTWTIASGGNSDPVLDDFKALDAELDDAERRRLLYVACTRAVDHLVVSLHRLPIPDPVDPPKLSFAALLARAGAAELPAGASALKPNPGSYSIIQSADPQPEWADFDAWSEEHKRATESASRATTISVTELAELLSSRAGASAHQSSSSGGPNGAAVGRAVHGVLQHCDLAAGTDIDEHVVSQCISEGIPDLAETVSGLCRSAIAAPIVRDAALSEHHRELFVASAVGDRVIEGYVDLLVRSPDGLVIIDYKTDAWGSASARRNGVERYRYQLAAYAVALETVIDEPIVGGVLVHCVLGGPAEELEIQHWNDAVTETRQALGV